MTLLINVAIATIFILLLIAGINAKWVMRMPGPFWANFRQEWFFNMFMFSALIVGAILGFFGYQYLQQLGVVERPEVIQIARVIVWGAGIVFAVGVVTVTITATGDAFRSDNKSDHVDGLVLIGLGLFFLYFISLMLLVGMFSQGDISLLLWNIPFLGSAIWATRRLMQAERMWKQQHAEQIRDRRVRDV